MNIESVFKKKDWVLPIIILSQFCCTSTWFAGNSIVEDLSRNFNLSEQSLGDISSAVQFGFILGTFLFAFLNLSDRFSPSKLFFICAILGASFNLGMLYQNNSLWGILSFRFLTGFTLAGIYPIGMKIASDHFKEGLGRSLSFLVGALVLGKAFPHLLKSFGYTLSWETVIYTTSAMALFGGLLILIFVGNGPHQKLATKFDASKILKIFRNPSVRTAAVGYFGHMWELYAFWTFLPVFILGYAEMHQTNINSYLFTFIVITAGAVACGLGGNLSKIFGVKKFAAIGLSISGFCCLVSPLFFLLNNKVVFILFLIIWGMAVIVDSPLFSTLVAQNSSANSKGTALTIVNCIGFAITIVSIQILNVIITNQFSIQYLFLVLAIGPLVGLINLRKT